MTRVGDMIATKQAVIFDLFHTLTAIESKWGPGTSEVLGIDPHLWNTLLLEQSDDRLLGRLSNAHEIVATLAHNADPGIPETRIDSTVVNRLKRMRRAIVQPPTEAVTTLAELRNRGKKLALISNADYCEIDAWDESPLAGFFAATMFSCEVGLKKPDPEMYHLCLRRLELASSECVFVGDGGSNELVGARSVGLTTLLMTGCIKDIWPEKIVQCRPAADFEIEHLTELLLPGDVNIQ